MPSEPSQRPLTAPPRLAPHSLPPWIMFLDADGAHPSLSLSSGGSGARRMWKAGRSGTGIAWLLEGATGGVAISDVWSWHSGGLLKGWFWGARRRALASNRWAGQG